MSSAIEQGSRENRNSVLYARRAPDVPLDADSEQEYYMKHLNDPNFDLKNNKPGSLRSYETEHDHLKKNDYSPSYIHDTDSQSDRYSSTKAESVADFEEYVWTSGTRCLGLTFGIVNRPIPKFVRQYPVLTTTICPATHFECEWKRAFQCCNAESILS